jgi:hypothetical protein
VSTHLDFIFTAIIANVFAFVLGKLHMSKSRDISARLFESFDSASVGARVRAAAFYHRALFAPSSARIPPSTRLLAAITSSPSKCPIS